MEVEVCPRGRVEAKLKGGVDVRVTIGLGLGLGLVFTIVFEFEGSSGMPGSEG